MKCLECIENGEKSHVYYGKTTSTCIIVNSYYNEDGKFVFDNPNIYITNYSCSNNHRWEEQTQREETTITRSSQT